MKYFLLVMLLIATSIWSDELTLNKIRFVINGEKLNWKVGDEIPVNEIYDGTQPETLLRFFKYKPGDVISEDRLKKEVDRSSFRLRDSNLFYLSSVSIVPPRKYPDRRTVVIKVNDGYRNLWGGGSIYGLAGKRNIQGRGNSVIFTLGINRASVSYTDNALGKSNFFSIYSLEYLNDLVEEDFNNASHFGELSYKLGYRFTPDFNLFIGSNYYTDEIDNDLFAGFNWKNKFNLYKENIFSINLSNKYTVKTKDLSSFIESKIKNSYSIGSISLNLKLAGGRDLVSGDNYSLSLVKNGISYIRSNYKEAELEGSWYLYSGLQIDKSLSTFTLPPIFNIKPIISLFADIAYINYEVKDAYGAAASIFFESPIFTSLDFSYGLNRLGEGEFIFTAKSHF